MGIIEKITRSETHAIKLLVADHREVDGLFASFEKAEGGSEQVSLVNQICKALIVHTEIEEKIFYPATREVLGKEDDQDMIDEAYVEHATLKGLILRLNGQTPATQYFKAYVTTLKEYVQHHVKEEESEYFPKVEKTELDLEQLGAEMKQLKDELTAKLDAVPQRSNVVTVTPAPEIPKKGGASSRTRGRAKKAARKAA